MHETQRVVEMSVRVAHHVHVDVRRGWIDPHQGVRLQHRERRLEQLLHHGLWDELAQVLRVVGSVRVLASMTRARLATHSGKLAALGPRDRGRRFFVIGMDVDLGSGRSVAGSTSDGVGAAAS